MRTFGQLEEYIVTNHLGPFPHAPTWNSSRLESKSQPYISPYIAYGVNSLGP